MSKIQRYSGFQLLRQALGGNTGWQRAWRDPEPKREYDVIIIGGGGHGLATAYYLATDQGKTSNMSGLAIMAADRRVPLTDVGTMNLTSTCHALSRRPFGTCLQRLPAPWN